MVTATATEMHDEQFFTRRALNEAAAAAVVPSAVIIGLLYALLAMIHPFFLEGPGKWVVVGNAALSALACAAIANAWRSRQHKLHPHRSVALIAGIVAFNTIAHFICYPVAEGTANFAALSIGLGLILLARRWYWTFQVILFLFWLSVVLIYEVFDLGNWGWLYFFAFFMSVVLHEQRIHATKAVANREALLQRRNQVIRGLVNAREWSPLNLSTLQQTICRAANEELGADATSIWLLDRNRQVVRRETTEVLPPVEVTFFSQPNTVDMDLATTLFAALDERRVVAVDDMKGDTHKAASLLGEHIARSFASQSLLLSAIVIGGETIGVVAHAYLRHTYDWSAEDRVFSSAIADISALAIQTHERAALEERTHQAERLESLGVLAGGVAHDFNNLLTVIMGNAELLTTSLDQSQIEEIDKAQAIMRASDRAKELARQMLAYSGRASFITQTIDLNALVKDISEQVGSVLLDQVDLDTSQVSDSVLPSSVDSTQIRQVIMNLLTNARDAGATRVEVATGRELLQQPSSDTVSMGGVLPPGDYCWVSVSDDGEGMDAQTQQRIFDPFFSTRVQGTGLGLAAVLGILRAHNGAITVHSTIGSGSVFRVYVPLAASRVSLEGPPAESTATTFDGRILLVDDEQMLSEYVAKLLGELGCDVTTIDSYRRFTEQIGALNLDLYDQALIDLTLGDGLGTDIVSKLRSIRPDLPIMIMSGYDATDALAGFAASETVAFLQKPFQRSQLISAWQDAKERVGKR